MIVEEKSFIKKPVTRDSSRIDKVVIPPGEFYCSNSHLIIQTLLGSCISACLYDRQNGVAGLNHFLLATPIYSISQPLLLSSPGRYGIHAMELLINGLMKMGAQRSQLRAKIFGGAAVLNYQEKDDFFRIPELNRKFIMEFLETERIPLDAADLGGASGRIIYFNTKSQDVILRYIPSRKTKVLEKNERNYWIKENNRPEGSQLFLF